MDNHRTYDFLIVGAGIVGLALARELRRRHADSAIAIIEKEIELGAHGSGRNSGVLHSGIYYDTGSVKAKVCAEGAREMYAFCQENNLPAKKLGKVIVPTRAEDDYQLDLLYERGTANGADVELIDEGQLRDIEPEARSATGRALYSPNTAVIDPKRVIARLAEELRSKHVDIILGSRVESIDSRTRRVGVRGEQISFGHLFNAAGLFADTLAKSCGCARRYAILPFKGLYWELAPGADFNLRGLIYPVPDARVPFLGVHFTKGVNEAIYLGPTAIPALGRENYRRLTGFDPPEAVRIIGRLLRHYIKNNQGFRRLTHEEGRRFIKRYFVEAARALAPRLKPEWLVRSHKVGIRAQLVDLTGAGLVMDFLVEKGENTTHILNAVSPGFTSAFSFARLVLDQYGGKDGA